MSELKQQVKTNRRSDRVAVILTTEQAEALLAKFDRVCVLAHSAARALQGHDIETAHDRLRTITCLCGGSRIEEYKGIKGK